MDKLKMHSPDLTQDNIAKIRELFPGCVTEARDETTGELRLAVDFDQLRQELSDHIVEGPQERYRLDWPGKREALALANAPIAKTLRPCREESVDFDATKNLFIEGDNLEALKLLQENYLGKVKMIYIDPPYNTGNDFVYEDDFGASAQDFLINSNQVAGSGERLVANKDSSGRFHSDWLDMIYPRIRIARKLLAEDGIIVASIDENEISNLRKVFDEVFGEENLLFQITLLCNPKGRSQDKYVANCHEYVVGYSKQQLPKGAVNVPKSDDEIAANYKLKDKRGRYRELELRNTHREFGKHNRQNLYYPFFVSAKGEVALEPGDGRKPVYPDWEDGFEGCWTWGLEKARSQLDEIVAKEVKGTWKIFRKNYAAGDDGEATKQVKSIWTDKIFHTEKGQAAFNALFETREKIFQSPKSVDTLRELIRMATRKDSIVLDFFAGSGTSAQAVLAQNAEDGGNRRFVMVQIAEPTPEGSEARKAGFATVVEITKERIRRAGKKILEGEFHPDWNRDVGFRVLKIDSSNMKDIYYRPDELSQADLLDAVDNVKPDRTAEDLLFQVLVDWGVDLTLPIRRETIQGKTVFFVDENALVACFDSGISEALVKELAKSEPLRVVFRDNGFESDAVKINVEQIFRQLSPTTEVRAI
ncbi:site-specific DNA-methyltransferase [Microbulbifer thermotolerans]|uniref:site-specific DNA-methyltransferase (adenine-specific) n=1 Tax=Microbulbifer thermotolerans TaxID=252514 RepID=A0AB35HW09_MICTH|nr:site-specific DNA-methyltransferase [Microbulbifer thermotolerans]MCX2801748.1 site-specific DNA-methyltransferase [Microbulbifer thermotolerans]